MMDKLLGRPFHEALTDLNLVSQKDADIQIIESILLGSRFVPENPQMFQLELLSRFSRAAGANSPVIGRMVAEAALMVLVTSERCIVPFYPCVSPSSAEVHHRTRYGPTHVLAVTTVQLHHEGPQREENGNEEEEEEEEQEVEKEVAAAAAAEEQEEEGDDEEEIEDEEENEEIEEDSDDSTTQALVWGERCGLQIWRTGLDHCTFQPFYHITDEVGSLLLRVET